MVITVKLNKRLYIVPFMPLKLIIYFIVDENWQKWHQESHGLFYRVA
jgi:hypothetical protein